MASQKTVQSTEGWIDTKQEEKADAAVPRCLEFGEAGVGFESLFLSVKISVMKFLICTCLF